MNQNDRLRDERRRALRSLFRRSNGVGKDSGKRRCANRFDATESRRKDDEESEMHDIDLPPKTGVQRKHAEDIQDLEWWG